MDKRGRKRDIPWFRILFGTLVVLFLLLTPLAVDRFNRSHLGSSRYQNLRAFFDDSIEIPGEWFRTEPYSEGFRQEREEIRVVLEGWQQAQHPPLRRVTESDRSMDLGQLLWEGRPLSDEEWEKIDQAVSSELYFLEAWSRFSKHPEYGIAHIPITVPRTRDIQLPNYLTIQLAARFGSMKGFLHLKRGEEEESLESFLNIFYLARRSPAEPLIAHMVAIACGNVGTESLARFAVGCENPDLLRQANAELNRIADSFHYGVLGHVAVNEVVGFLRLANFQHGYEFFVEPGQPAGFYHDQLYDRGSPMCEMFQDPIIGDVLRFIGPGSAIGRYFKLNELVYAVHYSNYPSVQTREEYSETTFALVRILLANRIREIEGKGPLTSIPRLSVEIGAEIGDDPFAGQPYFWNNAKKRFQSVGPDGTKDGNLRYSPTNGTKSSGDIWLPLGD